MTVLQIWRQGRGITAAFCGTCWASASPLVGLILFLVRKDTKPRTGRAAGVGALVSVICGIVFYVLMFIIGVGATML